MDLTPETLPTILTDLQTSTTIHTIPGISQIASAILITVNARPLLIPLLAQFSLTLSKSASPHNELANLSHQLLQMVLRRFATSCCIPYEAAFFSYLFQSFKYGLFTITDILRLMRSLEKSTQFRRSNCWLFIYFAPELEKADPQLSKTLFDYIQHNSQSPSFPQIFRNFSDQLDRLQSENWQQLKKRRDFFSDSQLPIHHIINDDIESLKNRTILPTVNLNTCILPNVFFPADVLLGYPTFIQVAAFFGATNCFRWLLSAGADLQATDRNFITLSQMAIAGGSIEIIRLCQHYNLDFQATIHSSLKYHRNIIFDWLLETTTINPNEADLTGQTPLHFACSFNHSSSIRRLIEIGADVNAFDYRHSTPLRVAVRHGYKECVSWLLTNPELDVNPRSANNLTPLGIAVKHGDVEIVEMLINKGARTDDYWGEGRTPLLIATQHHQFEMVKYLLTIPSVDPNAQRSDGMNTLFSAVALGWISLVKFLLEDSRIDVNVRGYNGLTPIGYAVRHKNIEMCHLLMTRSDIDLKVRNRDGSTLLHVSVAITEIFRMILERKVIDVNECNLTGLTALHRAAIVGNVEVIELLLQQPGIDPNVGAPGKGMPLHFAIAAKQMEAAEMLIAFPKTNINAQSKEWPPPINVAIAWDLGRTVTAICRRGDVDIKRKIDVRNGWPAIVIAAHQGKKEMLKTLLEIQGVDLEDEGFGGIHGQAVALEMGFHECAQMIEERMKDQKKKMITNVKKRIRKPGIIQRFWRKRRSLNDG
jgi:ankyrin repeat protein